MINFGDWQNIQRNTDLKAKKILTFKKVKSLIRQKK